MATSMDESADMAKQPNTSSDQTTEGQASKPTCIVVLGMAGSGKTTFVQVIK